MRLRLLTGLWLGAALMVQAQSPTSSSAAPLVRPTESVKFTFASTDSTGSRVYGATTSSIVNCLVDMGVKNFSDFANITLYSRENTSAEAEPIDIANFSEAPLKRFEMEPWEAFRRSEEPAWSTNLVFKVDFITKQIEIHLDKLEDHTEELLFFMIVPNGDSTRGSSSPYFAVTTSNSDLEFINNNAELLSTLDPAEFDSTSSKTDGNSPTTDSANGSSETGKSATMPGQATSSKGGSSGLATGAIAGIAVGAAVVLIAVIAAIWIILRRRKQQAHSHHADAATPLAAGYGGAAAAAGSRDFIGEKEPDPRHSTVSGAAIIGGAAAAPANASYTESGHQAYDEPVPAGHSPTDQQPPHHGSASGIQGVDSPVPSASVARHLVDEDMTADEIARLEEEEMELDRQIQEAGRRRQ